ncbi:MAG: FN3 associated domain-containing protein, partial [Clostridiales bacterium]|nr:FN3 associated domain-containing protein [Clostridiales bacterium]
YQIYDSNLVLLNSNTVSLEYGENKFTIRVIAENGKYANYPIMIYIQSYKCELLNKDEISNIIAKELNYTITPQISEKATYQIYNSNSVLLNSNTVSLAYGDNKFTIRVIAENGEYADYPITIYAQSDKCELLNKDEISNIITKESSYTIIPQISDKATYQIYNSNSVLLNSNTLSLAYGDNKFTIRVIAENGEYADYPITIYAQSDQCELLNKDALSCEVSNPVSEYVLTPQISEKAVYELYNEAGDRLEGNTVSLDIGENIFKIKVIAENTINSKTYTITITRREKLADITSNKKSGYYVFDKQNAVLTLNHSNASAKIYYTKDGTTPTTESTLYTGNLPITGTATIKAVAVCNGYDDSDVLTIDFNKAVAPTNLKIQSISSTSAVLTYSVPDGVTKYRLYYSVDRGGNWHQAFESKDIGSYINVAGLTPQTEYMFKVETFYADGLSLESNAILGKTTVYVSAECDILKIESPPDAVVDNDNNTITGARVMNSYSTLKLIVDVSDKASWAVYSTLGDARFSRNEITDKTISLNNEGADNYAYIKVVAEDEVHSRIYKIIVYRQSKSAAPSVSIKSNHVLKDTAIKLSADGEIIKYTTDGTDPSEVNGEIYTEPIIISSDTILKAAAKESDKDEYSDVVRHIYYVVDEDEIPTTKLAAPTNPSWTGSTAVWDAAENAQGYIVQLYKNNQTYGNAVETEGNSMDFGSYITQAGAYSFTVTSKGDGVYYENSDVSAISDIYDYTPEKIVITQDQIQINDITEKCTVIISAQGSQGLLHCKVLEISGDTVIDTDQLNLDNAEQIGVFIWSDLYRMQPIASKKQAL